MGPIPRCRDGRRDHVTQADEPSAAVRREHAGLRGSKWLTEPQKLDCLFNPIRYQVVSRLMRTFVPGKPLGAGPASV